MKSHTHTHTHSFSLSLSHYNGEPQYGKHNVREKEIPSHTLLQRAAEAKLPKQYATRSITSAYTCESLTTLSVTHHHLLVAQSFTLIIDHPSKPSQFETKDSKYNTNVLTFCTFKEEKV